MSTYDMALQRAQFSAKEYGESYFIYHQPEAWETRDTGWHVVDATEYYHGVTVIDENTVRCSVTWDDETGEFSIEDFHPWQYSRWHDG